MKSQILTLGVALLCGSAGAEPSRGGSDVASRFDGAWTATVTCTNWAGALGYSFAIPSQVTAGVLHGERMHAGEPGWLVLDGRIEPDGQAKLYAKGLVGASATAVGQQPKGTDYGYHVTAHFNESHGSGARVEGRPCDLDFARQ
ncbi:MAG TPA: hypothetical protein VII73_07330 [Caulobacteraceae bacterium]